MKSVKTRVWVSGHSPPILIPESQAVPLPISWGIQGAQSFRHAHLQTPQTPPAAVTYSLVSPGSLIH